MTGLIVSIGLVEGMCLWNAIFTGYWNKVDKKALRLAIAVFVLKDSFS